VRPDSPFTSRRARKRDPKTFSFTAMADDSPTLSGAGTGLAIDSGFMRNRTDLGSPMPSCAAMRTCPKCCFWLTVVVETQMLRGAT